MKEHLKKLRETRQKILDGTTDLMSEDNFDQLAQSGDLVMTSVNSKAKGNEELV